MAVKFPLTPHFAHLTTSPNDSLSLFLRRNGRHKGEVNCRESTRFYSISGSLHRTQLIPTTTAGLVRGGAYLRVTVWLTLLELGWKALNEPVDGILCVKGKRKCRKKHICEQTRMLIVKYDLKRWGSCSWGTLPTLGSFYPLLRRCQTCSSAFFVSWMIRSWRGRFSVQTQKSCWEIISNV